ncbi:HD-GYP domain-containing protein [Thermodesulfatator indicus]|uniref:HD-GYP domain-containing protein n=1 Tax=Thermodesulfatator indicus TaxID=171695 RepID=UPI0002F7A2AC|nr:HD-GYP domain-containing protein [Thermodesulfatator indicus]
MIVIKKKIKELQKTYHGIILILRHFLSKDEYTENHCYRVSVFATKIAQYMGLSDDRIEDLRSAALIHDIGKLKISREILYKAAKLTQKEFEHMKKHVTSATDILDPIKGSLGRVIPIVLAHHEKYDGTGYLGLEGRQIPIEAKILAVADVYDALISDRPYRKGLPPFEAKEIIVKGAGKHFDPEVVKAFVKAFEHGEMDLPNIMI